jgi:predicted MFS family arabinose efflux permease
VPQIKDWIPALTGMMCFALGAGLIGVYGFFAEHLAREFDVGLATINIGPVALLLVPGVMGPLVGKLVDRVPIRRIMLTGATIAMVSLCVSSSANSLFVAALGFVGFSLGLSMYGPVVVNGLLIKLYPGREARALAFAAMGISVATALLPPLVGVMLINLEWRMALTVLAVGVLLLLWLCILLGIPANAGVAIIDPEAAKADSNIYRQRSFWLVGTCVALVMNVAIIMAICYPPHFTSQGYTLAQAGLFISAAGIAGLFGKAALAVFAGTVSRHTKTVAIGLIAGQAIGLSLLLIATGVGQTLLVLCLAGACSGGFIPMHPYLNSRYFEARIIGRVNGAQMPLFLPLGLVGAPLAGYLYDQQGHYETVLMGLVCVLLVAILLASFLPSASK